MKRRSFGQYAPHAHALSLLEGRQCKQCPTESPKCNCPAGYGCSQTIQTCDACATATCVAPSSGKSSGTSKGALIGAVVGVAALLAVVVASYLYWKRRQARTRQLDILRAEKGGVMVPPGSRRISTATGLSRRPGEKPAGTTTPRSERSANPFEDGSQRSSISRLDLDGSGSTEGRSSGQKSPRIRASFGPQAGPAPSRPTRPNVKLRHDPFARGATNDEELVPPRINYAESERTGYSAMTADSATSSVMEALYETPTIVSAGARVNFGGATRAEVVHVGDLGESTPTTSSASFGLPLSTRRSLPGSSPLASSNFAGKESVFPTPLTTMKEEDEDPFRDENATGRLSTNSGLSSSHLSFTSGADSTPTGSLRYEPAVASRVNVGTLSRQATLRSVNGKASPGKSGPLDTSVGDSAGTPHQYPPSEANRSSITDSVLESFPFVPASPNTANDRSPRSMVFSYGPGPVGGGDRITSLPGMSMRSEVRQSNASSLQTRASSGVFTHDPSEDEQIPNIPSGTANFKNASFAGQTRASSQFAAAGSPFYAPSEQHPLATRSERHHDSSFSALSGPATSSRVSTVSNILGDYEFRFSEGEETPAMPNFPNTGTQDYTTSANFDPGLDSQHSRAPPQKQTQGLNSRRNPNVSRASLDVMEISRDLNANRLDLE